MRFLSAVALASLVAAGSAKAQGSTALNSNCTGVAGDVCQHAVDFFYYMTPQLGTAMTGGNTTLAQGGALGGLRLGFIPKIAVGLRVNAVLGSVPEFNPNTGPATQRSLTAGDGVVPMPALDVALGVFKGVNVGVSRVGGVDILASAIYIPEKTSGDFTLKPDGNLSMGFGVRVGLLQEGLAAPGIGFSFMKRSLPVMDLGVADGTGTVFFNVDDLDLSSTAWRLTISKSLLLFGVAAGYGQDSYKSSVATIAATSGGSSTGTGALVNDMKRTNMFGEAYIKLFMLRIVGTGGIVSGGDMATFYTYDKPADTKRTYGSLGVRLSF